MMEEIQIEKLVNEESFQVWNFQLQVILKANGLHEVVNGENLLENMKNDEEKTAWIRKDAKAQKLIVMSIDKKLMLHIMNCENAREMFNKLKSIFERYSEDQICNLLQQFYSLKFEKGSDMSSHISKIENLAHRLKVLNQKVDDKMIMSKVLSTLPDNYKHFNTAWESTATAERTLTNLIARLLAEESRGKEEEHEISFKSVEKKFYKKRFQNGNNVKCFRCGFNGHFARDCHNVGSSRSKQCSICKKTNHMEKNCFFRKDKNGDGTKMSFLTEREELRGIKHTNFIVDSGSSCHMASDNTLFSKLTINKSKIMVAKKNESMQAEGKGEIESEKCILKNVLYVPELTRNLLSVHAVTENGGEVIFSKDKVYIMKNNDKILEGKKENGLYTINIDKNECYLSENQNMKSKEWHRKLGHLGITNIKKLLDISEGIKLSKADCEAMEKCDICLKAKQTRLPFNSERQRATRILEIIHTDVCGPIDPETWDGKRYVLTILDDYTHFCEIYLMRNKYEVPEYLKEYIRRSEASKNMKVSKIRCDNGGEYINGDFKNWCKNKGIILDNSIAYSPQLNGKAERLNRTLMEKARALIFDSDFDKEMWGEAMYAATYLMNRNPTQNLEVTPSEKWTGRRPNLSYLQIFGSTAYAKRLGYLKKLDERSMKLRFVGYALNGYRLWDENKRNIKIYRDVVFIQNDVKKPRVKIHIQEKVDETSGNDQVQEIDHLEEGVNDEVQVISNSEEGIPDLEEGILEEEGIVVGTSRSGRKIRKPKKLSDYALDTEEIYSMLTYQEAINSEQRDQWLNAIEEEKKSLKDNNTWVYIDIRDIGNRKPLSSKWVFRIKEDGKFKARLVVRGFEQKYGIDYHETFSPVVNMTCLRILFGLAANKNFIIKKFDIKTAFLYGPLEEEIFMEVPEGYSEEGKVCLLKKSLYGLKQAPANWNKHFTNFLLSKGLIALKTESCIFKNENGTLFLAIYVDDGILFGNDNNQMEDLLRELETEFEMRTSNNPNSFLGIEVRRTEDLVALTQVNYAETILRKFSMENAKSLETPIVEYPTELQVALKTTFPYREIIGSLLYLTNKTRPDLQYAVNFCSRKMENPNHTDVVNVKRILRYLIGKEKEGISYSRNSDTKDLVAYCDSDFAGDKEGRKSTTGYILYFCGGPISWSSRKQPIVSLSSTEAEYIAAAECTKELLYVKAVIEELTEKNVNVTLKVDNQSAIKIIQNGQFTKRSKHIDVRYHFISEKIREKLLKIEYCRTDDQVADFFTKPLGKNKFKKFKDLIMIKI